jgi:hypothetical protein
MPHHAAFPGMSNLVIFFWVNFHARQIAANRGKSRQPKVVEK